MDPNASTIFADRAAQETASKFNWLHPPHHWPVQQDLLQWCQSMSPGAAALLMIGGIIFLLFGWYAFKGLITLNAAMVGGCLGAIIGDKLADSAAIGGIVGAVLMAAT